jgi:hypothetical protein
MAITQRRNLSDMEIADEFCIEGWFSIPQDMINPGTPRTGRREPKILCELGSQIKKQSPN